MDDKQNFIEKNIDLVYFLIGKYYPGFIHDEDIIQCGMVGLCDAAQRWKGGCKFSYYAKSRILGEIKQELRNRNKKSVETSLEQLMEGGTQI